MSYCVCRPPNTKTSRIAQKSLQFPEFSLLLYYCTKLHSSVSHTFKRSTNIIMPIEYLFGILQVQDKAHKVLFYLSTGPFVVHKVKRNYSLDGML
jgi:hypothetical protein